MTEPTLLLASGGAIGRFGSTFDDFGAPYTMRVRSVQLAPVGAGGLCVFPAFYLTVTFNVPFQVRCTPVLDGVELWGESVDIVVDSAPVDGRPQTHLFEVTMDRPRLRDGQEIGRYFLMGSWFQVEVAMPCPVGVEGIVDIELVEVEYEVLSKGGGAQ